jgi:hypothetical protein
MLAPTTATGDDTFMMEPDSVMERIGEGLAANQRGEHALARSIFGEIWDRIGGSDGDPFHRCAVAHSMADVQEDIDDELAWDLRALEAAALLTDERVRAGGVAGSARGFYPSLHLNLADVYRRLGGLERAREHVRLGTEAIDALGDDGYGTLVRGGLARIADQLGESPSDALRRDCTRRTG